eukprot:gene445-1845_t
MTDNQGAHLLDAAHGVGGTATRQLSKSGVAGYATGQISGAGGATSQLAGAGDVTNQLAGAGDATSQLSGAGGATSQQAGAGDADGATRQLVTIEPDGTGIPAPKLLRQCKHTEYINSDHQYKYLANASVRQAAQVYGGHQGRLRLAMDKYRRGENITVTFVGGSITAGQGAMDGMAFPSWATNILQHLLGSRLQTHNGAVPGALSSYTSVATTCTNRLSQILSS